MSSRYFTRYILLVFYYVYISRVNGFKIEMKTKDILVDPMGSWFNCSLEKTEKTLQLESIKWFKDDYLFYTYSAIETKFTFNPLLDKGVVDLEESKEGHVLLRSTNINSTGVYKCEVKLTDGRSQAKERNSTAIFLPLGEGSPNLSLQPRLEMMFQGDLQVVVISVDEHIEVTCESQASFPEAKLFIKLNGQRIPESSLEDVKVGSSVSWDKIRGLRFSNKLLTTFLSAKIKIRSDFVEKGFTRVICSSVLTLKQHGFIHQQDSDVVRVRVLSFRPKQYTHVRNERNKKWFYLFIIVTVGFVVANGYWEQYHKKKALKDENTVVVGSGSRIPYNNSEMDLCTLRDTAERRLSSPQK